VESPLIVFVHGGQHTKRCWEPTINLINSDAPQCQTLAVNLPGHGDAVGDLATLSISDCVDEVVDKIQKQAPQRVIIVGHSMAGITLPGVAARLGAARIQRMVYVACCIPPQGKRVIDTLHMPMNVVAGLASKLTKVSKPLPKWFASWVFANGATRAQKQFVCSCLCDESTKVTVEPVDRRNYPDVPTTWVLPLQDKALSPASQREFMQNLGRVDEVVEIDTCHNAMVSEPQALARAILAHY